VRLLAQKGKDPSPNLWPSTAQVFGNQAR
jgi:hypothetical protein